MSYYRICPDCGAHLDSCETCDCRDDEKAAPDAANIQERQGGMVVIDQISAFSLDENEGYCQV